MEYISKLHPPLGRLLVNTQREPGEGVKPEYDHTVAGVRSECTHQNVSACPSSTTARPSTPSESLSTCQLSRSASEPSTNSCRPTQRTDGGSDGRSDGRFDVLASGGSIAFFFWGGGALNVNLSTFIMHCLRFNVKNNVHRRTKAPTPPPPWSEGLTQDPARWDGRSGSYGVRRPADQGQCGGRGRLGETRWGQR